jgi:2,3-bisphosphoglycerate-independent phosphoglycerate mutase
MSLESAINSAMKPVMLCIMDGWGERAEADHNAIALADTPVYDRLRRDFPTGVMSASGDDVGLPDGQMGNSEVGHMNLGAGRVVMQDLPRIDAAVRDGSLATNLELRVFIDRLRQSGGRCHLMGLMSDGGVHSHQDHMAALTHILAEAGIDVLVHAILDGRDTPPKSASGALARFEAAHHPKARIATVIGRFFAMDRDNRWERVEAAYRASVLAEGHKVENAETAVQSAYGRGETDEFVEAGIVGGYDGMRDGDGLLFANFRADRAREILATLVDPEFSSFARPKLPVFAARAGMVEYSTGLNRHLTTLFPPIDLVQTLGEVVAEAGLKQLRIAETEKYPHVTFFLNGGREATFAGEERILIPSPKVKTYDLKPEMSADEVTDRLVEAIGTRRFDLIIANFANPDMVGHTGDLAAAIKAVETVDRCIGRVTEALEAVGGTMFLTADHGNCETMIDPETGNPHTAHTTNLVPTILVNAPANVAGLASGRLADVAPTLLELMGLPIPAAMGGHSLLIGHDRDIKMDVRAAG